ncbi:MAG: rhodanese-like domain-containing protein [Nitrospiraceae bacterium]|nr:rhodanese-like domain-containing protein [Nitrospiraceae bacterium]
MQIKRSGLLIVLSIFLFMAFCFNNALVQPAAADEAKLQSVKGNLKALANKSKTLSVAVPGKGTMIFKFTDQTALVNAKELKELQTEDMLGIDYKQVGADNVAVVITRAVAKLPPGVTEIKTPELAALVTKGPEAGNYFLVDSRPAGKCSEGYIPTAVNIPVPVLEKEEAKLLPADKSKLLIFYCGGVT